MSNAACNALKCSKCAGDCTDHSNNNQKDTCNRLKRKKKKHAESAVRWETVQQQPSARST